MRVGVCFDDSICFVICKYEVVCIWAVFSIVWFSLWVIIVCLVVVWVFLYVFVFYASVCHSFLSNVFFFFFE